ncbi:hypothetical protein [Anaerofustis sp.]|uniref:hypothetical protein n=1 Tax=Anaerofustis sp. TaxID=1872517 RepID=UPI0025C2D010|nr:hypothetical protein [Anaerofustis sp.]
MAKNWTVAELGNALIAGGDEAMEAVADAGKRFPTITTIMSSLVSSMPNEKAMENLKNFFNAVPEWGTIRKFDSIIKVEASEEEEEEVVKPAKKATGKRGRPAKKKVVEEEDDFDEEEDDEEEEEEVVKPAKKRGRPAKKAQAPAKKKKKVVEEEDDEDDDDWDI